MEEYISDNSVYARAKSNSMINPKMIGRVLGALLFIELGMVIYIVIERLLALKNAGRDEQNFMNNIRDFIHGGKIDSALALCKGNDTPLARMIEKGLSRIGKPLNDIAAAIENTGKLKLFLLFISIALGYLISSFILSVLAFGQNMASSIS